MSEVENQIREGQALERQLRIDITVNATLSGLEGFHQLQEDGSVTFLNVEHLVQRAHDVAEASERERARRMRMRDEARRELAAVPDVSPEGGE